MRREHHVRSGLPTGILAPCAHCCPPSHDSRDQPSAEQAPAVTSSTALDGLVEQRDELCDVRMVRDGLAKDFGWPGDQVREDG